MEDDVVRQAPLFAALDDEAADALKASMTRREVGRGEVLFNEGDPGDRLYVIVDGQGEAGPCLRRRTREPAGHASAPVRCSAS